MKTILRIFILPVITVILTSCSTNTDKNSAETTVDSTELTKSDSTTSKFTAEQLNNIETYVIPERKDTASTMTVDYDCAIFIYPTSEQMAEMEQEYGEDLATIADDYQFYQTQAQLLFDSLKISSMYFEKSFLNLQGNEKSWSLDVRKKGLPEWNMILFSKNKPPQIVSAIDMTSEKINEFFKGH
jgi:hypothetical protein